MTTAIDRKTFIGGSDIAAVMGLSRWKTPLRLWAEKTGKLEPPDLSDIERVEIGVELEEYVARKFERKTGFKVRRDNRDIRHPQYGYMRVHIDRLVLDGESILECKTTSAWMLKDWEGTDIPQEYVLQTMWGMGLLKRQRGFIAVLIGGQRFMWKEIVFDQGLFNRMVVSAKDFWENYVEADIPPMAMADDNETLSELYPESHDKVIQFSGADAEMLDHLIDDRNNGIQVKKETEKDLKETEAKIKAYLKDASAGETDKYRFTWQTVAKKEYTVPASSFRVFRTFQK
jgi:putative phage-type endonuclease